MPAIESPPLIDAVAAPISLVIFVGYHMFWIYRRSHHPETSMPALMGAIRKVIIINSRCGF